MSGQEDMPQQKPEQDKETGRFVSGNIGGGRPKGSRNKLGEHFISDMFADWEQHGAEAIEKVRANRPQDYLKVVASILPREIKHSHSYDDMSDEQLLKKLKALTQMAAPFLGEIGEDESGRAPVRH